MRRAALIIVFLLAALAGYIAGAVSPQLLVQPSLSASQSVPAYADTSKSYTVGYEVTLKVGGQNITVANSNASLGQGPRVGAVSIAYGLGYGLGAENYTTAEANVSEPANVIIPPPETVTQTITETVTQTVTETVVQTRTQQAQPQPPVVSTEPKHRIDPKWLGLGAIIFIIILLIKR